MCYGSVHSDVGVYKADAIIVNRYEAHVRMTESQSGGPNSMFRLLPLRLLVPSSECWTNNVMPSSNLARITVPRTLIQLCK